MLWNYWNFFFFLKNSQLIGLILLLVSPVVDEQNVKGEYACTQRFSEKMSKQSFRPGNAFQIF